MDLSRYKVTRTRAVIAGVLIYLCVGLIYAWSIFVTPLEAEFGWNRSETSTVFTISIIAMSTGCMVGSKLIKRFSSKIAISIGAVSMCVGLIMSSMIDTLPGLFICYGVFCGFGAGVAYNVNISTQQRWFPDKMGLISGILLMSYGMGSMVLSTLSSWMIAEFGWRMTFRMIGIGFGGLIIVCAQFIFMPSQQQYDYIVADTAEKIKSSAKKSVLPVEPGVEVGPIGMIKRKSWWLYFTWCVICTGIGLGTVSHAAMISLEISESMAIATFVTGMISVCNGCARLTFGAIYDYVARRKVMMVISLLQFAGPILLFTGIMSHAMPLLFAGAALSGFAYGGITTTNSLFIRRFYGNENYAENFGLLNFSGILSAFIGPSVAGIMQLEFSTYSHVMIYFLVLAAIAFVAQLLIKKA